MEHESMTSEDFLAHYGVKGMKWGVRKAHKPVTSRDIKAARQRIRRQREDLADQSYRVRTARNDRERTRETKKLSEMEVSFLKNPDRATELRMTGGEKAAAFILAVGLPGAGTVGATVGVSARVAMRKTIEKKQFEGAYGKKS